MFFLIFSEKKKHTIVEEENVSLVSEDSKALNRIRR